MDSQTQIVTFFTFLLYQWFPYVGEHTPNCTPNYDGAHTPNPTPIHFDANTLNHTPNYVDARQGCEDENPQGGPGRGGAKKRVNQLIQKFYKSA